MYPEGIETATVEMLLPDGRVVRARFSERRGRDFLFSYLNREPRELVERWSKKAS
jgi:hypothetical protein